MFTASVMTPSENYGSASFAFRGLRVSKVTPTLTWRRTLSVTRS